MLVARELRVKYRGSFLGYLWSMLNPLFFMIIISLVFSRLMRGIENYELYVLSGILFWNMTAHALVGGTGAIVGNAGLVLKVRTPIWVFALVPLGSAIVNFILALFPYLAIVMLRGHPIPWSLFLLPVLLLLYSLFLSGLALALATANVFFRDVMHVMEPVIQLLFYATPIIYDRSNPMIPPTIRYILGLNPFTRFVELFRATIFLPSSSSIALLIVLTVLSAVVLILGALVYRVNRNQLTFRV